MMVEHRTGDRDKRKSADSAFARRATDFDRIEYLAIALDAFAQSVPDYQPRLPQRIVKLLQCSDHSSPRSSRRWRSDASE